MNPSRLGRIPTLIGEVNHSDCLLRRVRAGAGFLAFSIRQLCIRLAERAALRQNRLRSAPDRGGRRVGTGDLTCAAPGECGMNNVDHIALSRKIRWRLAVPTILFMLLSSLDRSNVSFAALQMNAELGFSPSQYGFGAGILFAGFLAGQYPSVLLLQRIGMRAGWRSAP